MIALTSLTSTDLPTGQLDALRRLFAAAWPDGFTDEDFEHAIGGRHWLVEDDGRIVSHAAVVERELHVGERPLRTGYLEAVATDPACEGRGHGTAVVRAASDWIRERFELGALSTGEHGFYERLGWLRWRGPTFVRTPTGLLRTPDEDDGVMVLPTSTSPALDLTAAISCEWRAGDAW